MFCNRAPALPEHVTPTVRRHGDVRKSAEDSRKFLPWFLLKKKYININKHFLIIRKLDLL